MTLILLLSPAKTLDFSKTSIKLCTSPVFLKEAHFLVEELRKLSKTQLKKLYGASDAIAQVNYDRYQQFVHHEPSETPKLDEAHKQAVLSFNGPAYQGLQAMEWTSEDREFAQQHLRILCGLYGILKPFDQMQPYRLEMGTKFSPSKGASNLYSYWDSKITKSILDSFENKEPKILLNVASNEYFKSVQLDYIKEYASDVQVVHCVFKDDGRIKSAYAKRARGLLCRYVIQNRIGSLDNVKQFDLEGYKYSENQSQDDTLVFERTKAAADKAVAQVRNAKKARKA